MSNFFRASIAVLVLSVISIGSTAWAQPDGGRRGGFVPFGGGGGGNLGMLMRDDVRKELEIVDDQVEKLQALSSSMRDQMREMFSGFRDLSDDERRAKFQEVRGKMEQQREKLQGQINEILLPHQRDRLKQVALQMQMRYRGTSGVLSDRLAEELDITDEQKEQLRAKAEEVRKELDEKIQKARTEAREALFEVLTPDQRAKLKDLLGDEFQTDGGGFQRGRGEGGRSRPGGGGDRQPST